MENQELYSDSGQLTRDGLAHLMEYEAWKRTLSLGLEMRRNLLLLAHSIHSRSQLEFILGQSYDSNASCFDSGFHPD